MNESDRHSKSSHSNTEYRHECYPGSEADSIDPLPITDTSTSTYYEYLPQYAREYDGEYGQPNWSSQLPQCPQSYVEPHYQAPCPVLPTVTSPNYYFHKSELALDKVDINYWRDKFRSLRSRASNWWVNRFVS